MNDLRDHSVSSEYAGLTTEPVAVTLAICICASASASAGGVEVEVEGDRGLDSASTSASARQASQPVKWRSAGKAAQWARRSAGAKAGRCPEQPLTRLMVRQSR